MFLEFLIYTWRSSFQSRMSRVFDNQLQCQVKSLHPLVRTNLACWPCCRESGELVTAENVWKQEKHLIHKYPPVSCAIQLQRAPINLL